MRRLSYALTCLLLCLQLCGGTLGLLQVVAWGSMAVTYSREAGVVAGVSQTFDGEHPCEMCRSIAETREKESESPQAPSAPVKQLEWGHVAPSIAWNEETTLPSVESVELDGPTWPEGRFLHGLLGAAPPSPPPRDV